MERRSSCSPPLSFAADVVGVDGSRRLSGFTPPPAQLTPWTPLPALAEEDLPIFGGLRAPQPGQLYRGPAATLIGLDVLGHRRVIFKGA